MKATKNSASQTFRHPFISKKESVMLAQVLTVSMMEAILKDYHPMNRPRNTSRQRAMVRDIQNGDWKSEVGGFIRFDINGNLIDGQKRVHAHLEARMPFITNVQFGLPVESILYIDRNQPRTVAANVTLSKNVGANRQPTKDDFTHDRIEYSIASWCKYGLRWNEPGSSYDKPVWTERELLEFVTQNQRYISFVFNDDSTTTRPGVLGAIAVYAMKNFEEATQFRNLLFGTDANTPVLVGSPVHTLREYLKVRSSGGSAPIWDYFNTVRCINAFHGGQQITGTQLNNGRANFAF